MDIIYCWANYGQNMDHKLDKLWEKQDHKRNWAKYGKNMVHKMGKMWARFGPNMEQCFVYWFCWCIVCIMLWRVLCVFGLFVVVLVTVIYKWLINVYKSL